MEGLLAYMPVRINRGLSAAGNHARLRQNLAPRDEQPPPIPGREGASSPSTARVAGVPPANSRSTDRRARPRALPDGAWAQRHAGAASAPAPHDGDRSGHAHPDSAARAAGSPAGKPATGKGWRAARRVNLTALPVAQLVLASARPSVCSVCGPCRVSLDAAVGADHERASADSSAHRRNRRRPRRRAGSRSSSGTCAMKRRAL